MGSTAYRATVLGRGTVDACDAINNHGQHVWGYFEAEGPGYENFILARDGSEISGHFGEGLVRAINDSGFMAGNDRNEGVHVVSWDGSSESLGFYGDVEDINNSGVVVGTFRDVEAMPDEYFALVWTRGSPTTWAQTQLNTVGGTNAGARGVNNHHQVVGWAENEAGMIRAVRWSLDGSVTELDSVAGRESTATDINDSGTIVGFYRDGTGGKVAFVRDSILGDLRPLPGFAERDEESEAVAINDAGWIVVNTWSPTGTRRPYIVPPGDYPERLPFNADCAARGMNDVGEVVGVTHSFSSGSHGIVWQPLAPYTVSAGAAQYAGSGHEVTLHGSVVDTSGGSLETFTYAWEQIPGPGRQTVGPTVVSSGANSPDLRFTAPRHDGILRFRLVVAAASADNKTQYAVSDEVAITVYDTSGDPVYVSAAQGDDADTGSAAAPVRTLPRALALTELKPGYPSASPRVHIEAGLYPLLETLVLETPVRLIGGFRYDGVNTWTPDAMEPTRIIGPATAIRINAPPPGSSPEEHTDSVVIERFEINSADGADGSITGGEGGSSVCIDVVRGILVARSSTIRPGRGGNAAHGQPGAPGAAGGNGEDAVPAGLRTGYGQPGVGGTSPAGQRGGRGGFGGGFDELAEWFTTVPTTGNGSGLPGEDGEPGTGEPLGGAGGIAIYSEGNDYCSFIPVPSTTAEMKGGHGGYRIGLTAADDGNPKSGGKPGLPGERGGRGAPGRGGSGGGGGGSYYKCDFRNVLPPVGFLVPVCCYVGTGVPGGNGGGGGGGGQGGQGGEGGFAGGPSIGILIGDRGLYEITGNRFHLNDGGRGGDGATGGEGGTGGRPGWGKRAATYFASMREPISGAVFAAFPERSALFKAGGGGYGQPGQAGGRGGTGSGGGGGNSFGVYINKVGLVDMREAEANTFFRPGDGGPGGRGENPSHDGEPGIQKNWEVMGEPPGERIDIVEFVENIGKHESAVERLPLEPDVVLLEILTEWDGGEVSAKVQTELGTVVEPAGIHLGSGRAVYQFNLPGRGGGRDSGDPWSVVLERGDSSAEAHDLVSVTVRTLRNLPPVAKVRNLTLTAGPDGLATGSIDDGSYDPDEDDSLIVRQIPPGPYGVGAAVVRLEAEDRFGFLSTGEATVTVQDLTPPHLNVPKVVTLRADAYGQARTTLPVTASDNADPNPVIDIDEWTWYPPGITEVQVRAIDASGNVSEGVVRVVVTEETEPLRGSVVVYDFEQGTPDPFLPQVGDWAVADGRLVQSSLSGWGLAHHAIGPFQAYTVECELTLTEGELATVCYAMGGTVFPLDYRIDVGADFCRLTMPGLGEGWHSRTFTADGPGLPLNAPGQANRLSVAVGIEGVRVFLNHGLVHDQPWLDDVPLGDGLLSLGTQNAAAAFDNVTVATTLPLDPVVRLAFDNGTAQDLSGLGNHGTLHNGATIVEDPDRGLVLALDGTDDYVIVASDPSLDLEPGGQATIAAWAKTAGGGLPGAVVTRGGWDEAYSLLVGDATENVLWTGRSQPLYSGHAIPNDGWTHVAVVIRGREVTFFINGRVSGLSGQDPGAGIHPGSPYGLSIGREDRSGDGSAAQWFFQGSLDDIRVYPVALTEGEIQVVMGEAPPLPVAHPVLLEPICAQGENAADQTLEIWNAGGASLRYTLAEDIDWLDCHPNEGVVAGASDSIAIAYATEGLAAGTYEGEILLTATGPNVSTQMVAVILVVEPTPLTVVNTDDSGPGSLRQVMADAAPDDTVTFANHLSRQTITLSSGHLVLNKDLVIDASALVDGIVIDGANTSRLFAFESGTRNRLVGLTLVHGMASGPQPDNRGGAIHLNGGGQLTVAASTLSGNSADYGGAIHNSNGELVVVDCVIAGNSADYGGGINHQGLFPLQVERTTFRGNSASGRGGGLACYGTAPLTITESTFVANVAEYGGGIYNTNDGRLTIENATFSENAVAMHGGALYNLLTITLRHTTVSANHAAGHAGGVFNAGELALDHTVVAGNSSSLLPPNILGIFSESHSLTVGDPKLAPLGRYGGPTKTMPPLPGSPAMDTGLMTPDTPIADQRGALRPRGVSPDIGAVEAVAFAALGLADSEPDGIPDILEGPGRHYDHLTVGVDDRALDTDGDGSSDAEEVFNMTDLNDPSDSFRILSMEPATAFDPDTNPMFAIRLKVFPGLDYRLRVGPDLEHMDPADDSTVTAADHTATIELRLDADRLFVGGERE